MMQKSKGVQVGCTTRDARLPICSTRLRGTLVPGIRRATERRFAARAEMQPGSLCRQRVADGAPAHQRAHILADVVSTECAHIRWRLTHRVPLLVSSLGTPHFSWICARAHPLHGLLHLAAPRLQLLDHSQTSFRWNLNHRHVWAVSMLLWLTSRDWRTPCGSDVTARRSSRTVLIKGCARARVERCAWG